MSAFYIAPVKVKDVEKRNQVISSDAYQNILSIRHAATDVNISIS